MTFRTATLLVVCLLPAFGMAAGKAKRPPTPKPGDPSIVYSPPAVSEEDRPIATEITVAPEQSSFSFKVVFNKEPWGEDCKARCANATIFLDTDDTVATGLQLGPGAPETGADFAVVIQGAREYRDNTPDVFLRVKIRQFAVNAAAVEDGDTVGEFDHRRDPERVRSGDNTVFVLADATSGTLPSGKTVRVIYHPAGTSGLVGKAPGMFASSKGKVELFRGKPGARGGNETTPPQGASGHVHSEGDGHNH